MLGELADQRIDLAGEPVADGAPDQAAITKEHSGAGIVIHRNRRFAGGHKVSRIGCDEVWNSQRIRIVWNTIYSRSGGVT
jgi:hypothetical protein